MTTFKDGPAQGQTLLLKRAPLFLRVTVDAAGKVDALDQPLDTPLPTETLFAYVLASPVGVIHVSRRGGQGGVYTVAEYMLYKAQPSPTEARMTKGWQAWTAKHATQDDKGAWHAL